MGFWAGLRAWHFPTERVLPRCSPVPPLIISAVDQIKGTGGTISYNSSLFIVHLGAHIYLQSLFVDAADARLEVFNPATEPLFFFAIPLAQFSMLLFAVSDFSA